MSSDDNFLWEEGFTLDFDLKTGICENTASVKRRLSNMSDMFYDQQAAQEILKNDDPVIYEFYDLKAPENAGDLGFGTSIVYPGKIGNEYYMTKGHFHTVRDTCEVYYTLCGSGLMLIENKDGDTRALPLIPGNAAYVPKGYAHRSINTGSTKLVTFFSYRGDAGHDYGAIEKKGFHKMVVENEGHLKVISNPRWI